MQCINWILQEFFFGQNLRTECSLIHYKANFMDFLPFLNESIRSGVKQFNNCQAQGPTLGPTQGRVKVKVKVRTWSGHGQVRS